MISEHEIKDWWERKLANYLQNYTWRNRLMTVQAKERFVGRGFSQKEGIYYEETFVLVARYTSIKTFLSLASVVISQIT